MRKHIKQRTVYTVRYHGQVERVTLQSDGAERFYIEVHDGQKNAWTFTTRRKLEQVRDAIMAVLE